MRFFFGMQAGGRAEEGSGRNEGGSGLNEGGRKEVGRKGARGA